MMRRRRAVLAVGILLLCWSVAKPGSAQDPEEPQDPEESVPEEPIPAQTVADEEGADPEADESDEASDEPIGGAATAAPRPAKRPPDRIQFQLPFPAESSCFVYSKWSCPSAFELRDLL